MGIEMGRCTFNEWIIEFTPSIVKGTMILQRFTPCMAHPHARYLPICHKSAKARWAPTSNLHVLAVESLGCTTEDELSILNLGLERHNELVPVEQEDMIRVTRGIED